MSCVSHAVSSIMRCFLDRQGVLRSHEGRDGQPGIPGMSFLSAGSGNLFGGGAGSGFSTRGPDGYVPGAMPNSCPATAQLLPRGVISSCRRIFIHQVKSNGNKRNGLYFADKRPRQTVDVPLPPLFSSLSSMYRLEKNFRIAQSITCQLTFKPSASAGTLTTFVVQWK